VQHIFNVTLYILTSLTYVLYVYVTDDDDDEGDSDDDDDERVIGHTKISVEVRFAGLDLTSLVSKMTP